MSFDDVLKTSLVFAHFVASAVALATILRADFLILSRFSRQLAPKACERIHDVKSVVGAALTVLWLTGLAICIQGHLHDPAYLLNQKLWMKVLVVVVLTINGGFLHRFAFSHIRPGVQLCEAAPRQRAMLTLMASLSSASWAFACLLGIARALNNKPNFGDILGMYALVLAGVFATGLLVTNLLASWHRQGLAMPLSWLLLHDLPRDAEPRESELRF